MSIQLTLPWPPSVNSYYRNVKGRTMLSEKGRAYKKAVSRIVLTQRAAHHLTGRLVVGIVLYPPSAMKMDIDNRVKATLDALQNAGVFEDDSQVDSLQVTRGNTTRGVGMAQVRIETVAS